MRKSLLAIVPLLVGVGAPAAAAAPAWKISEVSGDVRLVEGGKVRAAVKGALLSSGSTIATGHGARAVIVRGEEFVVISPRSQLRVPAVAAASGGIVQMIQDFGTSLFKIQKKSTPHFGVQTPYLAAVVKGTTFTVAVGPEGGSVQVTEGAVQVSTLDGGAAELVRPGGIASVGASDLYRLTLEGDVVKAVRSPNAPAAASGSGTVKAAPHAAAGRVPGSVRAAPHSAAARGPRGQEMKITRAIGEKDKSLSAVTKGLVEGRTHDLALAEFRDQARAARKAGQNPGNGDGGNKPDKGDDKDKPDKGDDKDKPGKDEDKDKPGKDEDKDKPGKDGGEDKPGKDGGEDKPGKDDGKDKPGKDGGEDKPGEDAGQDKPGEDGGEDKPGQDDGKPDDKPADTPGDGDGAGGGEGDDGADDGKADDGGKGDDGKADDGKDDGGKGDDGDGKDGDGKDGDDGKADNDDDDDDDNGGDDDGDDDDDDGDDD